MWFLQPGITIEDVLIRILAVLAIIFVVLPFHEYLQAFVAYKLGDSTAKSLGLMTINPIEHFSPFGAVWIMLFDFGWAKPVPINPLNFKSPRKGMALVGIAGLVSYIFAAIIGAFSANLLLLLGLNYDIMRMVNSFSAHFVSINVGLAVVNLIPLAPFDGNKILGGFIPERFVSKYYQYQRIIAIVLFFMLVFGFFDIPLEFLRVVITGSIFKITSLPFLFIR